jgi:hypothetical protein
VTGVSLLSRHGSANGAWHDGVEARFRDLRNRTYRLQMLKDLGCTSLRQLRMFNGLHDARSWSCGGCMERDGGDEG